MDWIQITEILGNLGDFLGSIAVLATLLYFAAQMRAIRKQSETDYLSRQVDIFVSDSRLLATNRELRNILSRAHAVVDSHMLGETIFETTLRDGGLSEDDLLAANAHIHSLYLRHLNSARIAPDGNMASVMEKNWANTITRDKLVSLWWEGSQEVMLSHDVHKKFAETVNRILSSEGSRKYPGLSIRGSGVNTRTTEE